MKACKWFAIVWVLSLSCSKDDENAIPANARELLTASKWQLIEQIQIDSTGKSENLYPTLPSFRKDDYYLFKQDSSYEVNDYLELRSYTTELIIDAGRWELTNNNSVLQLHSNMYTTTYEPATIQELSASTLATETKYPGDRSIVRTRYRSLK